MTDKRDLDLCQCGDFRRSHKDGVGKCNFESHGSAPECKKFRFWKEASPEEIMERTGEAMSNPDELFVQQMADGQLIGDEELKRLIFLAREGAKAAATIEQLKKERDVLLENGADKIAGALTFLGDGDLFEVEEAMDVGFTRGFKAGLEAAAKCAEELSIRAAFYTINDCAAAIRALEPKQNPPKD